MTTLAQRTWNGAEGRPTRRSRTLGGILWTLQIVSAVMFVMAGASKLAGAPMMVQMFDTIGIGQWFRYATGTIEVVSALLLLIPPMSAYAAAVLTATMGGAILTHLFIIGGNPAVPVLLMATTATIAWLRRGDR